MHKFTLWLYNRMPAIVVGILCLQKGIRVQCNDGKISNVIFEKEE